jgi:hypothetical protein
MVVAVSGTTPISEPLPHVLAFVVTGGVTGGSDTNTPPSNEIASIAITSCHSHPVPLAQQSASNNRYYTQRICCYNKSLSRRSLNPTPVVSELIFS